MVRAALSSSRRFNQAPPRFSVLLPAVSVEPSGLMAPIGDQVWINWLNYFLHDYYSSGVSTYGCGTEKLAEWFKAEPLPLTWNY